MHKTQREPAGESLATATRPSRHEKPLRAEVALLARRGYETPLKDKARHGMERPEPGAGSGSVYFSSA